MAFVSSQIELNSSTATALYTFEALPDNAQNPPGNTGAVASGEVGDPIPVALICSAAVYLGGPGVTSSNGFLLPANVPFTATVFGSSEILYALAVSATPIMNVLLGRQ